MKNILQFIIFALCLLSEAIALGAQKKESIFSDITSEGKLTIFAASMPQQSSNEADTSEVGLEANLKWVKVWNKNWSANFSPYFRGNFATKEASQNGLFDPQEFSILHNRETDKIFFGFHHESWEGTDVINPMDILNPKIYLNPLSAVDRSAAGLFYLDQTENFSWQFIFIPSQIKSVLPGDRSPWWPRQFNLPTQTENLELRINKDIQYRIQNDQVLNQALSNNLAVHFGWSLNNLDLQLAAVEAAAPTPILSPSLNVTPIQVSPKQIYQLQAPVLITPYYYKRRAVASSLVWTMSNYVLRLASQYAQSIGDSSLLPDWSHLSTIELEKNLSHRSSDLTLILEAVYTRKADSSAVASISNVFDRGALLGLRWQFAEKWTWMSSIYQDLGKSSIFVHNQLKWAHHDSWSSEISFDSFQGSSDSSIGAYDQNDQIRYQLTYSY